jgi:long-chain acyl-CoA synthetase
MDSIVESRFKEYDKFYDESLYKVYKSIGYPSSWIEEGKNYHHDDAYVIFHPSWSNEEIPAIPLISVYDLFRLSVEKHGNDTAIIFLDKPITYRELDELINQYASMLLDFGVQKGDVVAVMLPNSLQHWVAFLGANRIGAVHSPLNAMYKEDEIEYQLRDSGAKIVLTLDLFAGNFIKLQKSLGIKKILVTNVRDFSNPDAIISTALKPIWDIQKRGIDGTLDLFETIKKYNPTNMVVPCKPKEDVALLLYTAGTTGGVSKGVMQTHFNVVFNSFSHTHFTKIWKRREVNFSIMPMFHASGYHLHTLPTLYQGGTVIPIPMFDVIDALRIIQQYRVNTIFAPPTLFIALLQQLKQRKHDISSLELTVGCGTAVPPAVQKAWYDAANITLTNGWGMTETNCGGCMSCVGRKEKLESIGVPIFSEVKIVDDKGQIVKRGIEGEIVYRGLQVSKGYLNKPEETRAVFQKDGWLKTGDIGFIDEEDFLHFIDRKKDLIIASGYNIAPVDVEKVLYQHHAVMEAAVIGVFDEYRGETVKAFVVLKAEYQEKVTGNDIIAFCKEKLATFKVPRIVEFIDAVPKNPQGKVLKRVLRDREKAKN